MKTRDLLRLALALSLGLSLHVIERMLPLPALPFPGVKLGLANLVSLGAIFWFDYSQGLTLIILRCVLASFFGGGFSAFLYSLSGALISFHLIRTLAYLFPNAFSLPILSVAGAVAHNISQIALSCLLMQTLSLLIYLPVLIIAGSISGLAIGFTALILIRGLSASGLLPNIPKKLTPLLDLSYKK